MSRLIAFYLLFEDDWSPAAQMLVILSAHIRSLNRGKTIPCSSYGQFNLDRLQIESFAAENHSLLLVTPSTRTHELQTRHHGTNPLPRSLPPRYRHD